MTKLDNQVAELREQIAAMGPWHHNIRLTDNLTTADPFTSKGYLDPEENDGVSLINPRDGFIKQMKSLYPDGMQGRRFLDCACNAGGYCFFARELGASYTLGFDVRKHWIDQANFVREHRAVGPTDQMEFREMDLLQLGEQNLEPFDFTFFSGILYHLPDPITGLKAAADLTKDVLLLNTAGVENVEHPYGMTLVHEGVIPVMSGVHQLAWFPNSPEVMIEVLFWMGFKETKITKYRKGKNGRTRFEILAAREHGRLKKVAGKFSPAKVMAGKAQVKSASQCLDSENPGFWQKLKWRLGWL